MADIADEDFALANKCAKTMLQAIGDDYPDHIVFGAMCQVLAFLISQRSNNPEMGIQLANRYLESMIKAGPTLQ